MDFNAFKEKVIEVCKARGVTEYELYYSTSESTNLETFKHEIKEFSSGLRGGVAFRCIVDGKMGSASTEELSEAQAESIVARAMDNASILEDEDEVFFGKAGETYEPLEMEAYELPTTAQLTQIALEGDKALYDADPAVIDGSAAMVSSGTDYIALVNSNGVDLSARFDLSLFLTQAVVTDGKDMADSYEIYHGAFDKLDMAALTKKAVEDAKVTLDADVAPTGAYTVVFSPKAMCSLLSTFSEIFSSENAQKGLSSLADREGERIAASIVTIVDDPFYKESSMPIHFDAEGSPTYKKNVVENGVLTTLLYDLKTAAIAGKRTTGNATRRSYTAKPEIRPFTMYIAPGELTEEELLKKAGNGVYITFLGGLHAGANPITGDFSLQSGGFMIENGVKTKYVKSFTVAGNFYDLLNQITDLSNEVKLPGFGGMTSFGSPAVLVEGLTIAGK